MQITINVATITIGEKSVPMTEKIIMQLPHWCNYTGDMGRPEVVCQCSTRDGQVVLLQARHGLCRISYSNFINTGLDRGLGVDYRTIPTVILT